MGVELVSGMLESAVMERWRPTVMVNWAFMFGSSKQGKARRASTGSICVVAIHLEQSRRNLFSHVFWKSCNFLLKVYIGALPH